MTVLLTPSLKPFFGGTYFPKERFMRIVTDAHARFQDERSQVESEGDEIYAKIARSPTQTRREIQERPQGCGLRIAFDLEWGGRKGRMKFPTPVRWRFLMHAGSWGGDEVEAGVRKTLDMMASEAFRITGRGFTATTEHLAGAPLREDAYDNAQSPLSMREPQAPFKSPVTSLSRSRPWTSCSRVRPEGLATMTRTAEVRDLLCVDSKAAKGARPSRWRAGLALGVTEGSNSEHKTSILTWRSSTTRWPRRPGGAPRRSRPSRQPVLYKPGPSGSQPGLDKARDLLERAGHSARDRFAGIPT